MFAHTYSWYVSNVQCVGSTTRLPSHSAQVEETSRSLYNSESGVKKMAMGHPLGEHSHTIERSHNLLSVERVERQDLSTWMKVSQSGVWDLCGLEIWVWHCRGIGVWDQRVGWVFGLHPAGLHFLPCCVWYALYE